MPMVGSSYFRNYAQEKIMTEEVNTTETEVSTEEPQVQLSLQDIATMV